MYNDLDGVELQKIPNNVPLIAYVRVSTDKQFVHNQINQIENGAFHKGITKADLQFINAKETSTRESGPERKLDEVFKLLGVNGVFIATEISRLGRSTSEVVGIIEKRLKIGNRLIFINQGLDLNPRTPFSFINNIIVSIFASVAQLERDLISQRTKMALATRKQHGIKLGRPKGISTSMYDKHLQQIKEYLKANLTVSSIAKLLQKDYQIGSQRSLAHFIKKHKIVEKLGKESNSK